MAWKRSGVQFPLAPQVDSPGVSRRSQHRRSEAQEAANRPLSARRAPNGWHRCRCNSPAGAGVRSTGTPAARAAPDGCRRSQPAPHRRGRVRSGGHDAPSRARVVRAGMVARVMWRGANPSIDTTSTGERGAVVPAEYGRGTASCGICGSGVGSELAMVTIIACPDGSGGPRGDASDAMARLSEVLTGPARCLP